MNINGIEISNIVSPEEMHVATSPLGQSYLQRDGYLAARNLFLVADLRSLKAEIGRIPHELLQPSVLRELGEPTGLTPGQFDTMQINWLDRLIPDFAERVVCSTARNLALHLLGEEAHLTFASYIVKTPTRAGWTPWHQDGAYDQTTALKSMTVWIPFHEASIDNGCLCYSRQSHNSGLRPHSKSKFGDSLVAELNPTDEIVACPIPEGGAAVHLRRTMHCALPNRSEFARGALSLNFVANRRT
jgi:phytanoyl-CoA hydroxylase